MKGWLILLGMLWAGLAAGFGQVERIDSLEVEDLRVPVSAELTIASGAVTRTGSFHTVDTEGDAASDDLATISGGTVGDVLIVYPASDARTVVLDHGTGNILCGGATDITLDQSIDWALLIYDGTNWLATGFTGPGGGGGGATAFTGLSDVPSSYSGQGGKLVAVNSGASALEFVTGTGLFLGRTIGDYTVDASPDGSADYVLFYDGSASTWDRVLIDDLGVGGGGGDTLPVVDTTGIAKGSADATKVVRLEVDGLTTGTTRVITVPDADVDLTPTTGTFQGSDATLTALAGLSTGDRQVPIFTGTDTVTQMTVTPAGQELINDNDAAAMRTTLGLVIGTNVQAYDAELAALAGLTSGADTLGYFTGTGTAGTTTLSSAGRALIDDADAAAQRTTLGLGTMATQASGAVTITGGSVSGITDLAVADGGTGASNAAGARTNLGLVIGTDVQAYDAELAALAGVTSGADTLAYFTGSGTAGTTTLSTAGRNLIDDASTADQRTTLGLGTLATQSASAVTISGGSISGITDLAIADGGTGASNASGARTNLGLVIGTDVQAYDADLADLADGTLTGSKVEDVFLLNSGDVGTGVFDFGGATSVEIPNGASPTVDASGEIAIDTTWTNVSGGLITYHDGTSAKVVPAMTLAELNTANDGDVLSYNATTDVFELVAGGGGGSGAPFTVSAGTPFLQDNTDSTKQVAFDVSDVATSTVRTITVPDAAIDLTPGTGSYAAASTALEALGAVTVSANEVPYFTSGSSASTFTTTGFGRGLVDDADAAAARTTLGLVPGTDVQAYDGDLAAIAALTPTKGNLLVGNGSAWVAVGVGTNDQVLTADSTQSSGVKWAAATAGAPLYRKTKTATQESSVVTLADVSDLTWAVDANKTYRITWVGAISTTGSGNGATLAIKGPSGATFVSARISIASSETARREETVSAYEDEVTQLTAIGATPQTFSVEALVVNGSTSGTVALRFASEVAAGATATIAAGAWSTLHEGTAP